MSPPTSTDATAATPLVTPEAPWLGLRAFTEAAASYFFGRDRELTELFDRVAQKPLTILFGQSGLGKTSLLQAALLPRLRQAGFVPVLLRLDHADDADRLDVQVLNALADAVQARTDRGIDDATTLLASGNPVGLWELLHDPARGFAVPDAPRAVLVLDQFEEIFTLGEASRLRREASIAFLQTLADVLENRVPEAMRQRLERDDALADRVDYAARPLKVVLSLREDFLYRLERWRGRMPSLMENRFELRLLTGPQALQAVLEPGRLRCKHDRTLPPLVDEPTGAAIVRFVANVDEGVPLEEIDAVPPLLSLLCAELNAARKPGEVVQKAQLQGSADGILTQFYARCLQPHPAALTHFLEDRLLSPEGFRQAVNHDTFVHAMRAVGIDQGDAERRLRELVDARLLVSEERGGVRRIEITHDTLTGVMRTSRDERLQREEARRRRRKRQVLAGAVLGVAVLVAAICAPLAYWALQERDQATKAKLAAVADRERADARVRELNQLAGSMLYERAVAAADDLYPAWPSKVAAMEAWLRDQADPLLAMRPEVERKVAELRARALPGGTAEQAQFAETSDRFLHDSLVELLQHFGDLERLRADVERRRTIAGMSLSHPQARATWAQARAALGKADGIVASTLYAGQAIELRDQDVEGLVPIGMNPVTKLWEFYELRSAWDGESDPASIPIPQHRADGTIEVTAATGIVFVLLPGGKSTMGAQKDDPNGPHFDADADGDEQPVHAVALAPFFLARHELTVAQWQRLVGEPRSTGNDLGSDPTHPATFIDWTSASTWMARHGLRLPTEAQWEYGCRAGTTTPWWTGATANTLAGAANVYDDDQVADGVERSAPVGSFRANAFGLHDTHGNVWEWCQDAPVDYSVVPRALDGERTAEDSPGYRVSRGGSFGSSAAYARSAIRRRNDPSIRIDYLGLRPTRTSRL